MWSGSGLPILLPQGILHSFSGLQRHPLHTCTRMIACAQKYNFKIVILKYLSLLSSLLHQRRYIRNLWTGWEGQQKVQAQHQESYLEILTSAEVSLFHTSRSIEAIGSIKSFFFPRASSSAWCRDISPVYHNKFLVISKWLPSGNIQMS